MMSAAFDIEKHRGRQNLGIMPDGAAAATCCQRYGKCPLAQDPIEAGRQASMLCHAPARSSWYRNLLDAHIELFDFTLILASWMTPSGARRRHDLDEGRRQSTGDAIGHDAAFPPWRMLGRLWAPRRHRSSRAPICPTGAAISPLCGPGRGRQPRPSCHAQARRLMLKRSISSAHASA